MYYNLYYAPFPEILKRKNTSQKYENNDILKYENINKHISPKDQKDILNKLSW